MHCADKIQICTDTIHISLFTKNVYVQLELLLCRQQGRYQVIAFSTHDEINIIMYTVTLTFNTSTVQIYVVLKIGNLNSG